MLSAGTGPQWPCGGRLLLVLGPLSPGLTPQHLPSWPAPLLQGLGEVSSLGRCLERTEIWPPPPRSAVQPVPRAPWRVAAGHALPRLPHALWSQVFLSKVEETFQCICCQELVFRPVTTVCQHNVCKVRRGVGGGWGRPPQPAASRGLLLAPAALVALALAGPRSWWSPALPTLPNPQPHQPASELPFCLAEGPGQGRGAAGLPEVWGEL